MQVIGLDGPDGHLDVMIQGSIDGGNMLKVQIIAYSDDAYTLVKDSADDRNEVLAQIAPFIADECDEVGILFSEDTKMVVQVTRADYSGE